MTADSPLLFLIAGEPSGDVLGAALMRALRRLVPTIRFIGIGGDEMAAEGLRSLISISELAVMGLVEILPKARHLLRRIAETVDAITAADPDAVIGIDSGGFTNRVGERLKRRRHRPLLIHYVAPMVWAWRPHRAAVLARSADHVMTLLPFEPPYFEAVGLRATYVGHPVVESRAGQGDGDAFRRRHEVAPDKIVISVLPGSRRAEAARLLPVFGKAAALLAARLGDPLVVVPTVSTVSAQVEAAVKRWPLRCIVVHGAADKFDAFAASRAALAASGSVALELAMAKLPMVISYRVFPPTAWVLDRVIRVRYVSLPNILLNRRLVPELLQRDCVPAKLADAVARLVQDEDARERQIAGTQEALRMIGLGDTPPSERAAACVLELLARRPFQPRSASGT